MMRDSLTRPSACRSERGRDAVSGQLVCEVPAEELAHRRIPASRNIARTAGQSAVDEIGLPHDDAMAPRYQRGTELVGEVPVHRSDDRGSQTGRVVDFVRDVVEVTTVNGTVLMVAGSDKATTPSLHHQYRASAMRCCEVCGSAPPDKN